MSSRAVPLVAAVDPEVTEKAKRRTFTAEYKRRIFGEADACTRPGEIGALLRPRGAVLVAPGRLAAAREAGELEAEPKKRGRSRRLSTRGQEDRELERAARERTGAASGPRDSSTSKKKLRSSSGRRPRARIVMIALMRRVGTGAASRRLRRAGHAAATYYRRRRPKLDEARGELAPRRSTPDRTQHVLARDAPSRASSTSPPPQVYATLLDEEPTSARRARCTACSPAHRRSASGATSCATRAYAKPELLATAPNQVWSWDITKLLGPAKWTYFYLYVILDIFSRYVVGWMVAEQRERARWPSG